MAVWDQLKQELNDSWPVERWTAVNVVVGCSGGADSVALTRALCDLRFAVPEARGGITVAHYNHRLRGRESDEDEAFVRQLAAHHQVACAVDRASVLETDEASLRASRLAFLHAVAEQAGARYVALAHSADDRAETMLLNLMRGTGPAGLCGIRLFRDLGADLVLVRPLLRSRRETIRLALSSIAQPWREDASNQDPKFRRNWIRGQLIGLMESQYPTVVESLVRASEAQDCWREVIDRLASAWLDQHLQQTSSGSAVLVECDLQTEPAIVIFALQKLWRRQRWSEQAMTAEHWQRLASTISGQLPERYSLPGSIDVIATGMYVELRPGSGQRSGSGDRTARAPT